MSLTSAQASAIRTRFRDQVATPNSLPTFYDNQRVPEQPEDRIWCRWTVIEGDSRQAERGAPTKRYRTVGVAVAQLFGPIGSGDGALRTLADTISNSFRTISAGGVTYLTPSTQPVGVADGSKHWQLNVRCAFYADQVA